MNSSTEEHQSPVTSDFFEKKKKTFKESGFGRI